jgi:hypothetical protein
MVRDRNDVAGCPAIESPGHPGSAAIPRGARPNHIKSRRGLGFRESEVRGVLSELRDNAALRGANVEGWLPAALQRLMPATR